MPPAVTSTPVASKAPDHAYGPPKPRVLCVDDEPQMLESLRDSLRRRFEVVVTTSGFEALRMLTERPFHVVLSDMRMPLLNGARFLTLAREHAPDTVRLLLTGQSTLDDAVAAVNEGEIFRFLIKPCPHRELIAVLDSAVERHRTLVHERELNEQSVAGAARALADVAVSIDPGSPAREQRIRRLAAELVAAADVTTGVGELDRACEVMQVGVVGLPPEMRDQLSRGRQIDLGQVAELERLPELAERFVARIPHLSAVAVLLSAVAQPLVPTRPGLAGTPPLARVLRIALDFDLLTAHGLAPAGALKRLLDRGDRYDPSLLDTFADLVGAA